MLESIDDLGRESISWIDGTPGSPVTDMIVDWVWACTPCGRMSPKVWVWKVYPGTPALG